MIKTPLNKAVKSKGMLGGFFLIVVGVYLIYKGDTNTGMLAIGNGMGIMGIRDAQ